MERHEEVSAKHEQLRRLMRERGADGILLTRTANIAWFTGGADASIYVPTDTGAYSVLVTPERRTVVTNPIEQPRISSEDALEQYGFEYHVSPWYAPDPPRTPAMLTDADLGPELQRLRWVLLPPEEERLRALGHDAALALEEAARAVQPGDTEYEVAARTDAACRRRGGMAVVNLVASDERISRFRHPLPSSRRVERLVMLVTCMRRHGLVVSATRLIHFGPLPAELAQKARQVAAIDAAVIAATRPGRTLGEVFDDIAAAYAANDQVGQWMLHHQGGIAGYAARERIATPGDDTPVSAHQAYAWNPSVVGCKSEDTVLVSESGAEVVTVGDGRWPTINVNAAGRVIPRPAILEL